MELNKKTERRLLELKVQFSRYHYFRAKSELNMLKAVDQEDYETAAQERDNLSVFDDKIEEVTKKRNELIKNNNHEH